MMKLLCIILLMTIAVFFTACSKNEDHTEQQRLCIARQYNSYDRKQIDQCVQVCKNCFGGNTTTCSTSCKLNGAS